MKVRGWISLGILMVFAILISSCANNKSEESHVHDEYTCPMHPEILRDKPGSCPICGMDLVKKSQTGNEQAVSQEIKELVKPTNTSVVASVKSVSPQQRSVEVPVNVTGVITYDTRNTYAIPVRFGGRIEKLFLKYNYQPVKKGEVIMQIYSPDLVTAQRELIFLTGKHAEHSDMIDAAKQKLFLLGLTEKQVENIISNGKENYSFPVLSPYDGYMVESSVREDASAMDSQTSSMGKRAGSGMGNGMQSSSGTAAAAPPVTQGSQVSIREGMYVTAGQSLFKVIDQTRLWAELNVSGTHARQIRKGDKINLSVKGLSDTVSSTVDLIQPFFSEGKQFLQVRSYLQDKDNKLRVGQLVTATLNHASQALWVPKLAVLDLGVQQIVFLKNKEAFQPYKIKTGLQTDDWIEVIEGLDESSVIAENAQFLIDSESFIKVVNP